jgi:DNA polymerase elongation subunit (family B)
MGNPFKHNLPLRDRGRQVSDKIDFLLTSITYSEDEELHLILFGRGADGKRRIVKVYGVAPDFYVPTKPHISGEHGELVRSVEQSNIQTTDGVFPWKITTRLPRDVRELRKYFGHTYQADVLFTDKCRFDLGIKDYIRIPDRESINAHEIEIPEEHPNIEPNYVILDAELDDREGFPTADNPIGAFLCISFYSYQKDRYYSLFQGSMDWDRVIDHLRDYARKNSDMHKLLAGEVERLTTDPESIKTIVRDDEKSLLSTLGPILHKLETDMIGGWNVWRFDMPVVNARMTAIGMDPHVLSEIGRLNGQGGRRPIVGIPIFDTSDGWQKLLRSKPESWKLDYVSQKELKAGKMQKFPKGIGWEWFHGDREAVMAYNILDVVLVKAINDKLNVLDYNWGVARTAGADIEEVFYSSKLIDNYVFHRLQGSIILPTQKRGKDRTEKFKGAVVFTPPAGVHHNVIVLDLKSLYPNIIISCKIDPTTIIKQGEKVPEDYIITPNGQMFRKDKPGIIPDILKEMIAYRKQFKDAMKKHDKGSDEYRKYDAMQFSYKTLTNAIYGVLGYGGFRLMDVRCGESVTAVGRAIINWSADRVREKGYEVVYCDTDSVFVKGPEDANLQQLIDLGYELSAYLNSTYDDFAAQLRIAPGEHTFQMEFEKAYRRLFFSVKASGEGTKKKYAGRMVYAA